MQHGDFIMEHGHHGQRFMSRVWLEWQDENPRQPGERDWNNPWHRAQMIEEQRAFRARSETASGREIKEWMESMKRATYQPSDTFH